MRFDVFSTRAAASLLLFLSLAGIASAEQVSYSGKVTYNGVTPVADGYVIAGTFKPTFSPYSYKYAYGIDGEGNMDSPRLTQAIADGNFIPIGSGVETLPDGTFSGAGLNPSAPGQQIYLFAFNNVEPDEAYLFALATAPGWITSTTSITIDGADASSFVFGQKGNSTIALQGLPTPEPSSFAMLSAGLIACGWLRSPRR